MDLNPMTPPALWRHVRARPRDRYLVGADLGQSQDYTAISVLWHRVIVPGTVTSDEKRQLHIHDYTERFDIVRLERLPLGMPYPDQVAYVKDLKSREPLIDAKLVVDETGVGRPVCDLFDRAGLRPQRVTITSGLEATQHSGNSWHVPKAVLISNLEAKMHTAELKVAPSILNNGALKDELADFERHVTASGRATWGGRTEHDDLILSIAIVLWFATNRMNEITVEELRL
jgi:hypothetical protein